MISTIEKVLRKEMNISPKTNLSYLKYSTPISGKGVGCKVIFFVFVGENKMPSFVVKSVRTESNASSIREGYKNTSLLNSLTKNTEFDSMFPKMIHIHDDNGGIFTIETMCSGLKMGRDENIDKVFKIYTSFSKHLLSSSKDKILLNFEYGKKILESLNGSKEDIDSLSKYLLGLWNNLNVELPSIYQHGDLTIDNILLDRGNVRMIDCDTFGNIRVPGFDIFHLSTRKKLSNSLDRLNTYFKDMNISYTVDKKILSIYFLHELYIKKDYILLKKNSEEVIKDFENILKIYNLN